MPLEKWLIKFKKTISPPTKPSVVIKRSKIGVFAFKVAGIMPKLTHIWRFVSDENIDHLRNQSICLEGVSKVVSNKDGLLMGLACGEIIENLKVLAVTVSRVSKRCEDSSLRSFEPVFGVFANTGHNPYGWVLNIKDMEAKNIKKMERYVAATDMLYKAMDELTVIENSLKKSLHQQVVNTTKQQKLLVLDFWTFRVKST
ncbi:protein PSK SIMULATOR 1-like [Bidens hawaiensis]|uniref:protein PSK SIMULATOR 1-like n=1 Tax=Bidens hawaiensis TaxID=980011 RepID=UPI00404A6F49